MDDFLKFFAEKVKTYPMHLEITYSKVTDWGVRVWRRGTAYDGGVEELVNVQDCDAELCFATVQVQLKNWLLEIAQSLGIRENTLQKHLQNIFRKTNVTSRWELLRLRMQ